ncbi:uncharacterized protein LOC143300470 [Babylonia areolata]|uniref:uncharacterized protein LOC143300470 n=1 Tax=Babylonia areolata TaxID=304850 RepID=UPI003FD0A0DC
MAIRVAVIGAGAAGLCAVRHLASRSPTFSVKAFEQSSGVGGTWAYTDATGTDCRGLPVHSSMYRNLKTNLPKEVMAFPDFEFDKQLPSFIRHQDVLQYLKDYATYFNILQHIQFDTHVVKVEPVLCGKEESQTGHGQKWQVTTAPVLQKTSTVTEEFDAVIVCNGHYALPLIPSIPGLESFPGEIMHSHNYRHPEHFQDKRVLCLGAAASGQDICLDLSSAAELVYLCHNKAPLQSKLPPNVQQKPGIRSVKGSTVTLNNEEEITVDCLLFCTGYRYDFPFLTDSCNLRIEDERVTPLYKHLIHTQLPSLSFIGICKTVCPFPQFHIQVLLVLATLDGSCRLPSREEMDADAEADFQKRLSEGLPKRYAHLMAVRQWDYNDVIAHMAGCRPIKRGVQSLYDAVHEVRVKNLMDYKKVNYEMIDEEHFQIVGQ